LKLDHARYVLVSEVMMKPVQLSIGSWAYCFGPYQANPVPFETVIEKLGELGFDGVELGGFPPHPSPTSFDTSAKRTGLKRKVADRQLKFSGLAADLWSYPIIPVEDNSPWMAAFESNLQFAEDLGIDCIRVDSVSPPDIFEKERLDPRVGWDRLVGTFRAASQKAADRGIRVVWEFEPGFAFNKPSEILRMADAVDHKNFSILFDTCHAHICAALGARQSGEKETLPGGALELLTALKGKIGHIHLIDSDGTLHHNETSTHAPFGQGVLDFDRLIPEVLRAGCPSNWWTIDLCFWPNAWDVTADAKVYLDGMARKYASQVAG
jgi:sugar phosphate isomerase/epimerase